MIKYDKMNNLEKYVYDVIYMVLEQNEEDFIDCEEIEEYAREIADDEELNNLISSLVLDKLRLED